MRNYYYIFVLIFILIRAESIFAQEPLHRHYTIQDGLPSSTIFPLIQDQDGFIWFGTDVGVTRFDGKKFQNFTLADGLSDNYILNVKTDSKGRIWFLGFNGTVSYWLHGEIFNSDKDTLLKKIVSSNSFIDLFEDNNKRIWFITQYEYIVLDNTKVFRSNLEYKQTSFIMNGKSGQIVLTNNKPYFDWAVSQNISYLKPHFKIKEESGYWRLKDQSVFYVSDDGIVWQSDTSQKMIISFHGIFNNTRLGSMSLSSDSMLWVTAMGKGLYCYDLRAPKSKPVIYLKNKIISGVLCDKEGNIWVSSTDEGLYLITSLGIKVKLYEKGNGLYENATAITKQSNGILMVGFNDGKIQRITDSIISEEIIPEYNNYSKTITRILSRNDDVWIASEAGLIHQNKKTGCNHFVNIPDSYHPPFKRLINVKDITFSNSKLFIATGLQIFEYPLNCNNQNIKATNIKERSLRNYSIYCDHANQLWFGTIKGLQSKKDSIFIDHSNENIFLADRINSIAETEDSVLVLATHGHGILFYKNGQVIHHTTTFNGLSNDICLRVSIHKNKIYVSTISGVSVLYYSKGIILSIHNINTSNYLPSDDVNDVFANDNEIAVATTAGISVIEPGALDKINPRIPILQITSIQVGEKEESTKFNVTLNYNENHLKCKFIGIYFQQPDEVNYRYRIREDQQWEYTGNTELEFSFLPPAKYIFQIQARIFNGPWTPVQTFRFTITPPFWKTIWFRVLVLLILISFFYFLIKYQLKVNRQHLIEKTNIENQITRLEQQALQTMMNPHFIFNVMNSIQFFINANEKEAANHYLSDFASLIRLNLTISYKRIIPLEEEINYLKLYLKFEKLRFGENLTFEIIIDTSINIEETTIAVMMIQPFVENAIWHGILPNNGKGHLKIEILKESNDLLKIIIEDNGVGINEKYINVDLTLETKNSHALSMTLQRLNLLGKASGHKLLLSYRYLHPEFENKGTVAEFLLPAVMY